MTAVEGPLARIAGPAALEHFDRWLREHFEGNHRFLGAHAERLKYSWTEELYSLSAGGGAGVCGARDPVPGQWARRSTQTARSP